MKRTIISATLFLLTFTVFGQQIGNRVIGKQYNSRQSNEISRLYLSDTSFIVQANVLINVIADSYVATFGVSESSTSLKDANSKINKRIKDFSAALAKFGISETDIYRYDNTNSNS